MTIKEIIKKVNPQEVFPNARKSGKAWVMLCPFHNENKPSFYVYQDGAYHCFGCGKHGTWVQYLVQTGQVQNNKEAIQYLANLAGVEINLNGVKGKYKELYDFNDKVCQFFQEKLKKEHLKILGISSEEVAKVFRIGFAPPGYSNSKLFPQEFLKKVGLINENGREILAGRIIIPITEYSLIKGFVGKKINDNDDSPKYINTHNSEIFEKRKILYNLNPEEIKKKDYVIIVEGYTDIFALYQAGYKSTVALMGCNIDDVQIRKIQKLTKKVLLIMDGDEAGRKATIEIARKLIENDFTVKIALLPNGMDPKDYVENGGKFSELFREKVDAEDYLLEKTTSWEDKFFLLKSIASKYKRSPEKLIEFTKKFDNDTHRLFQEIQAAFVLEEFVKSTGKIVYKQKDIEIIRWFGNFIVYKNQKFWFTIKISDPVEDKKKLAEIFEGGKQ